MKKLVILTAMAALAGCTTLPPEFQALTAGGESGAASAATTTVVTQPVMTVQDYEKDLLEADRRLGMLAAQKGLGMALAEMSDPNEGFVLTDRGMFAGGAAIASGLQSLPNAGPLFWQADRVSVSNGGDFGMTSGNYVQVLTGAEAAQGRYVTVWRKDTVGAWRVLGGVNVAKPPTPKPVVTAKKK